MTRRPISPGKRYRILRKSGFRCHYCGAKAGDVQLEPDHVVPVAKGGTNDIGNLVAACPSCNRGKGDKAATPPTGPVLVTANKPVVDTTERPAPVRMVCEECGGGIVEPGDGGVEFFDLLTGRYPGENAWVRLVHTSCTPEGCYWVSLARITPGPFKQAGDKTIEDWCYHLRQKRWFSQEVEAEFRDRAAGSPRLRLV